MAQSAPLMMGSPDTDYRKRLANALMQQGTDTSPVGHWTQGLARLAQALVGSSMQNDIRDREAAGWGQFLEAAGAGSQRPQPNPQMAALLMGGPAPTSQPASNSSPGLLAEDADMMARTIHAEAGNQPMEGKQAVGNVILNRSQMSGQPIQAEIQKPNQFEPWNTTGGRTRMASLDPNSREYMEAELAALNAKEADRTQGATHFYAPKAQAALGRQAPAWDNGTGRDIGDHRFFNHPYGGQQPAQPAAAPNQQMAQAGGMDPRVSAALRNPDIPMQQKLWLLSKQNPDLKTVDLGSEIGMIDGQGNVRQRIPKTEAPKWGVIGKNELDQDIHGWIDPSRRNVERGPSMSPATVTQGDALPAPPPGADPKQWRSEATKNRAQNTLPASFEDTSALRREVLGLPSYKNYSQASPIYRSMSETAGRDSRASDLNLVYGLGKIMDPTSVVREGEMVMVKNTASLPDWLAGAINQVNGGAGLTPDTRKAIMAEAHSRMKSYEDSFESDAQHYRGIVGRSRMTEDDVIPRFAPSQPWSPQPPAAAIPQSAGIMSPTPMSAQNPATGWVDVGGGVRIREKR